MIDLETKHLNVAVDRGTKKLTLDELIRTLKKHERLVWVCESWHARLRDSIGYTPISMTRTPAEKMTWCVLAGLLGRIEVTGRMTCTPKKNINQSIHPSIDQPKYYI